MISTLALSLCTSKSGSNSSTEHPTCRAAEQIMNRADTAIRHGGPQLQSACIGQHHGSKHGHETVSWHSIKLDFLARGFAHMRTDKGLCQLTGQEGRGDSTGDATGVHQFAKHAPLRYRMIYATLPLCKDYLTVVRLQGLFACCGQLHTGGLACCSDRSSSPREK